MSSHNPHGGRRGHADEKTALVIKKTWKAGPTAGGSVEKKKKGYMSTSAKHHHAHRHHSHGPVMSYTLVLLLMCNRSMNLILYKALTTFSYYFATDFGIPYSVFAWVAIMNFPATLLNVAVVPFYTTFRIDMVLITFEIMLAGACMLVLGWHNVYGLVFLRFATGFAITAVRSEVNAMIGAYIPKGRRRTRSISLLELSFGLSAAGFLGVGAALQYLGWRWFFLICAICILLLTVAIFVCVPEWRIQDALKQRQTSHPHSHAHKAIGGHSKAETKGLLAPVSEFEMRRRRKEEFTVDETSAVSQTAFSARVPKLISGSASGSSDTEISTTQVMDDDTLVRVDEEEAGLREELKLTREKPFETPPLSRSQIFSEIGGNSALWIVFMCQTVNKVTRNAFYYTFSIWLATTYALTPTMAGAVSLMMAAGHLLGTSSNSFMVPHLGVYGTCLLGAFCQFLAQFTLFISFLFDFVIPLGLVCIVVFLYFYGCQVWYNNILDISMQMNANPALQPTIQTIFLAAGAGGGMCGTLASTHLWDWNGIGAIGMLGSFFSMVLMSLVITVWGLSKTPKYQAMHKLLPTSPGKDRLATPIYESESPYLHKQSSVSDESGIPLSLPIVMEQMGFKLQDVDESSQTSTSSDLNAAV